MSIGLWVDLRVLAAVVEGLPDAKKWTLNNQVAPDQFGLGFIDEIRSYLKGLSDRELAETLIGGSLSTDEFPDQLGG